MNKKSNKKNPPDKRKVSKKDENYVIVDAGAIEILVSKNDPWYTKIHEKFPNERPFEPEDLDTPSESAPTISNTYSKL